MVLSWFGWWWHSGSFHVDGLDSIVGREGTQIGVLPPLLVHPIVVSMAASSSSLSVLTSILLDTSFMALSMVQGSLLWQVSSMLWQLSCTGLLLCRLCYDHWLLFRPFSWAVLTLLVCWCFICLQVLLPYILHLILHFHSSTDFVEKGECASSILVSLCALPVLHTHFLPLSLHYNEQQQTS